MMPPVVEDLMQRPARVPSHLPESLHKRLNAYALAASAAGVGILALVPPTEYLVPSGIALVGVFALSEPAEAKIVYTPAHKGMTCSYHTTHCTRSWLFDLNHDGIGDVGFFEAHDRGTGKCRFDAKPVSGNGIEEGTLGHGYAEALEAGENIGHAKQFNPASSVLMASETNVGYWHYEQPHYLGVVFQIKGKTHYGWMRLKYSGCYGATLTGYAYETIPNKPIIAGKTKGPDVITAQPATLGHLAAGASVGVRP
jgi:hypothetical protein